MVSDKDVYISANILVKQHGEEAEQYTIDMINNKKGGFLWRRILEAIKVLKNKEADVIN